MPPRTLVIVNPRSAGGAARRRFQALEARLREKLGPLDLEWTRAPRDAERIAREGVRAGAERLVVAGGDGTVSEVVSGLLGADLGSYAQIGLLPFGTGGDLPRTLGLPADPEAAIDSIADGKSRRLDAGRVRYQAPGGDEATAFFLNVSSVGISGLTTALVNRAPKWLGGRISFLLGTVRAILRYDFPEVRIQLDGATIHDGPLVLATAANGRYFGGGMKIAPEAEPDDERFDVVVMPGLSRLRLLREMPRLYDGSHVGVHGVSLTRGTRLEAESPGHEVWIEVDGEPLGTLPACFELLPGAITLVGCG